MLSRSRINQELVRSLKFLSVSFASALSNILYIAVVSHLTTLPFWFVSLSSTEFSMVVNFVLNDRFTFRNLETNRPWYVRLARFQVAAIGGNLLTALISTVLHSGAGLSPVVSQVIAILLTFFVNFLVHRFWTFRASSPAAPQAGAAASEASGPATFPRVRISGVSVIIPARNEQPTMRTLLLRLHEALAPLGIPYEALVIDDHSTDDTAKAAAQTIEAYGLPARVLLKQGHPGKSFSLMEGFDAARYPVLAMIDGDLELPPESLPGMMRDLGRYDVVVGRRLDYGKDNTVRAQISAAFNKLVMRLFLGINFEVQTGIKVFWKHVYESVELNPGQWGFDMEFVAKALAEGFRIGEHPVPFQKRQLGQSKVNPVVVAMELISSAVRIKLDILQTAKASATLKVRAVSANGRAHGPAPAIVSLNSAFPLVVEWLAPLAVLYVLLHAVMGPAFFSSTHYFAVPGDTNQYMWFIGWMWQAIKHGQSPLVTSAFNYPNTINIMDYTSVPAIGLLFGWLIPLTGLVFTFNLIVIMNYLFIFVFGKLTLRALGVGRVISGVGGVLFCLLPYITTQEIGHLNIFFVTPHFIVAYCLVRITQSERRPSWMLGLLIGLALTFAFYTFLETFVTMALCIVVVFACGLVSAFKPTYQTALRMVNVRFLAGVIAPLLLIIPGLLNFIQGVGSQSDFALMAPTFSNDLLSLILPSQYYLVHNYATTMLTNQFTGNAAEWNGYLSIPLIILVIVVAARRWNKPSTRILTLAATVMIVLSLGPYLHIGGIQTHVQLPWIWILKVPFVQDALPARVGFYAEYLAVILISLGAEDVARQAMVSWRSIRPNFALGINLVLLALVALFWLPALPSDTSQMPEAASILRSDDVVTRYIAHQPTLVLNNRIDGFSIVMGVLADANDFDIVTSNVYGHIMGYTPSFKINTTFINDTDGKQTNVALRQYLPQMGVGKVMFVSIDDQPLDATRLKEISKYLGAPIYDRQGLVVVWNVPTGINSIAASTKP